MYRCLFALAVLGSSACYPSPDSYDPGPSGQSYRAYRPSSWNYHRRWHGGYRRYNQNGDSQSLNTQNNNPTQAEFDGQDEGSTQLNVTAPDSGKLGQNENVSSEPADQVKNPITFNVDNSSADLHQNVRPTESEKIGQEGNGTSETAQQIKNPFIFNNQDSGSDLHVSGEPAESKNNGALPSQTADQANKPFYFNNQDSTLNINQDDTTSEPEKNGQSGNVTTQSANTDSKPFKFNNQETDTLSREDRPSESGGINQSTSDITRPVRPPPSTPRPAASPGIGSYPVPLLEQFLAPSLQWHVGIYTKTSTPYSQICGGSLVKTDVVLTAAHCFWNDAEGALRPALFAAAAGKLQRAWDASSDAYAQRSDIREIHIPPRFRGAKTSFQDDIAVARLSAPLRYAPGVQPACVDFGLALEREQLQSGREGTVVGWGLTEPNGPPSERLNVLALAYLDIEQCIARAHPSFLKYITSDKICAGDYVSGKAACRGDSGGGLVFTDDNIPYIRGVASTAYRSGDDCNAYTPATFTLITFHSTFLADHVPNIAEDCRTLYTQVNTNEETDGSTLVTTDAPSESISTDSSAGNAESGQLQPNVTIKVEDGGNSYVVPVPLPFKALSKGNATQAVFNLQLTLSVTLA